jgi:hypothetical protein
MTHTEFLEKLRTFPPNEKARFYCPTNKIYHYYLFHEIEEGIYTYYVGQMNGTYITFSYEHVILQAQNYNKFPFRIIDAHTMRNFQLI